RIERDARRPTHPDEWRRLRHGGGAAREEPLVQQFVAECRDIALDVGLDRGELFGQHSTDVADCYSAVKALPHNVTDSVETVKERASPDQPLPVEFPALDARCRGRNEVECRSAQGRESLRRRARIS